MRMPLMIALIGLLLGGCTRPPQTGAGFYLPPGDAQRGRVVFVKMNCNACHTVSGVDLPASRTPGPKIVQLGGDVTRVRSYGDLVTSIIYPAHSSSELLHTTPNETRAAFVMPDLAADMSVAQLVDVVTFLAPHYRRVVPTNYGFPPTP